MAALKDPVEIVNDELGGRHDDEPVVVDRKAFDRVYKARGWRLASDPEGSGEVTHVDDSDVAIGEAWHKTASADEV
jgi:hypothetical protein